MTHAQATYTAQEIKRRYPTESPDWQLRAAALLNRLYEIFGVAL